MALEQRLFHIVVEILAILVSGYFIFLSRKFSGWKRWALIIISTGVILIDIYALLSWAGLVGIFDKVWFHVLTEALAIPAGVILIHLSFQKIEDKLGSIALFLMGIANFLVDGYLILTWFL